LSALPLEKELGSLTSSICNFGLCIISFDVALLSTDCGTAMEKADEKEKAESNLGDSIHLGLDDDDDGDSELSRSSWYSANMIIKDWHLTSMQSMVICLFQMLGSCL
jgi:hypothetical protein